MKHVVVIEGEQPQLKLLAWGLMDVGYRVTVTVDATAAIETLRDREPPDAVIFNVSADAADKRDAIERIRGEAPGTRIVDVAEPDEATSGADASLQPRGLSVDDVVDAVDPPDWMR